MNTIPDCVDPSVHGNPFRYCPHCDWREPEPPPTGAQMIAAERQRQIDAEGWTPQHDDHHDEGELACAATAYMFQTVFEMNGVPEIWPWADKFWKPSEDVVVNLVKAGALIAAEIDRIQRFRGAS